MFVYDAMVWESSGIPQVSPSKVVASTSVLGKSAAVKPISLIAACMGTITLRAAWVARLSSCMAATSGPWPECTAATMRW